MARVILSRFSSSALVPRPFRAQSGRALSAVLRWVSALPAASELQHLPARAKHLRRAALDAARKRWPYLAKLVVVSTTRTGPATVREIQGLEELSPVSSLDPARLQEYVSSLRNPSAEVAVAATLSLRSFGYPAAAPLREAFDNLDGFFHPAVRAAAVRALATVLPADAGDLFAEGTADPDVEVSLAAISALVSRRDPMAIEVLLSVVENLSGFYVHPTRLAAARGLRQLGVTGTSLLGELCNTEANLEIREALAHLAS